MPNFDRTGPHGKGPVTGRGRGRCRGDRSNKLENNGEQNAENNDAIYGLGRGGRPRGAGERGNRFGGGYRKGFRREKKHGYGRRSGGE